MSSQNTQFLVREKGGSLVASTSAKPAIADSNELIIRIEAVAVNPADIKMIDEGHRIQSWPLVAGLDGAGVVEAVGDGVKNFAVGDEVIALFTAGDRAASFQKFAVVQEGKVARKPAKWSFEDAATLGVCYMTAIVGLGIGLKMPLPFLKDGAAEGFEPTSVLVLGGSSALGAATIQLLRLTVPNCKIMTTSSPKHHSHLVDHLGTDKVFDRSSTSLVADIKAASPSSQGVDAIIDTVGAARTDSAIFEALSPSGPKRYAQVWTGDDEIEAPVGVNSIMWRGKNISDLQGGQNIMQALQTLLEGEKYKLPLPVHRVGEGLHALEEALDLMRNGVSGKKLAVAL